MPDNHSKHQRSHNMSRIRSRDSRPELAVRSLIHRMGYRFRLHDKRLPGKPDIVLPRHRKIVLVHGCFWHLHNCKRGNVSPKTNEVYWNQKLNGNVQRDSLNILAYKSLGWECLVVWECETKNEFMLNEKLNSFFS